MLMTNLSHSFALGLYYLVNRKSSKCVHYDTMTSTNSCSLFVAPLFRNSFFTFDNYIVVAYNTRTIKSILFRGDLIKIIV